MEKKYIKCNSSGGGDAYTKGKIYIVKNENSATYNTELDNYKSTTNGWGKRFFDIVTEEEYNIQEAINNNIYVKAIKSKQNCIIINQIYKYISAKECVTCNIKSGDYKPNSPIYCSEHYFIPSTKEEYEAQLNPLNNIAIQVDSQKEYLECLSWLKDKGEEMYTTCKDFTVEYNWNYVIKTIDGWRLTDSSNNTKVTKWHELKPKCKSRVRFNIGDLVKFNCNPTVYNEFGMNGFLSSSYNYTGAIRNISSTHPDLVQLDGFTGWYMEDQLSLVKSVTKGEITKPTKIDRNKIIILDNKEQYEKVKSYLIELGESVYDETYKDEYKNLIFRNNSWDTTSIGEKCGFEIIHFNELNIPNNSNLNTFDCIPNKIKEYPVTEKESFKKLELYKEENKEESNVIIIKGIHEEIKRIIPLIEIKNAEEFKPNTILTLKTIKKI